MWKQLTKMTHQVLGHTVGQDLLQRIRKVGSRSDVRTRGIIGRILCDTHRQKLTCPLEFLWPSHLFPGQGLRVRADSRSNAGRHPYPEKPLSLPTMNICCPCESESSLCVWPVICSPRDTALSRFLIVFSVFIYSLDRQASCIHCVPGTLGRQGE